MARLQVLDGPPDFISEGFSKKNEVLTDEYFVSPSLVRISLRGEREGVWPVETQHVIEVEGRKVPVGPKIVLRSWEEEFVLVLSHELRHVDCYWNNSNMYDVEEAERDAEATAVRVLEEFRRKSVQVRLRA